jgi:ABC-type transport system involved in multi-copper enzyme maturation permease subunit
VTGLLRSELLKLRTTRTTWGLLLVEIALVVLAVVAQGLSSTALELEFADNERTLFGSGTGATLIAAFVGMLSVTTEFRYGTIRPALVFEPRRRRLLAAKVAVSAFAGLLLGMIGAGLAFAIGLPILSARSVGLALGDRDLVLIGVGTVAASVAWAVLGVAVGALVRHQIGAIVALVAWNTVVESIFLAFVPGVGRYLPGNAGNALAGAAGEKLLSMGAGGAVIAAWALALALAASVRTDRTDIG